jgi:hypothetical protein
VRSRRDRRSRSIIAAGLLAALPACGTLYNFQMNAREGGPFPYGGVGADFSMLGNAASDAFGTREGHGRGDLPFFFLFALLFPIELPLSFVFDTLTLPYTIPVYATNPPLRAPVPVDFRSVAVVEREDVLTIEVSAVSPVSSEVIEYGSGEIARGPSRVVYLKPGSSDSPSSPKMCLVLTHTDLPQRRSEDAIEIVPSLGAAVVETGPLGAIDASNVHPLSADEWREAPILVLHRETACVDVYLPDPIREEMSLEKDLKIRFLLTR